MTTARKRNEEIIKKSYSDPVFFIKTFCKIQHPIKGVVPFKLYPFQEDLIQTVIDNPYVVVNKSRQLGISTVSAAFCLWYCIFHHTKNILVIATKRDVAKNFVDKCKFMYENLPTGLKKFAPLTIDNAQEIGFGHTNSKIKAVGTSKDAGRSEALSWLFVDEAAFIKDMDDIWTSIWPTLSTGGRCMMLSTPEGTSNVFYQTYAQAKSGENDFIAVDLPWDVHPDRDEKWKEKQIKTFGQKRFDQEYDCDFSAQTNAFLTPETFDFLKDTVEEPRENWRHYGKMWVWENPIPHEEYAIGVDVASGVAKDYSTVQVIKAKTNEQVAEFHAKVDTSDFAKIVCDIGVQYNNAVLCIERNNLGDSVIKKIRDHIGYQKLLFTDSFGNPIVTNTYDGFNTPGLKAGFNMQTKSRMNVLNVVSEGLATKSYRVRSERLLNEFRTFVVRNGKPEHEKNKNDDLIIAYALALWTREYCLKTIASGIEFQESFLNAVSRDTVAPADLNPDVTGFGMGFSKAPGEDHGIYSPYGPVEKSTGGSSLHHNSSRYDKKKGRVVRTRIVDPFGNDRF